MRGMAPVLDSLWLSTAVLMQAAPRQDSGRALQSVFARRIRNHQFGIDRPSTWADAEPRRLCRQEAEWHAPGYDLAAVHPPEHSALLHVPDAAVPLKCPANL